MSRELYVRSVTLSRCLVNPRHKSSKPGKCNAKWPLWRTFPCFAHCPAVYYAYNDTCAVCLSERLCRFVSLLLQVRDGDDDDDNYDVDLWSLKRYHFNRKELNHALYMRLKFCISFRSFLFSKTSTPPRVWRYRQWKVDAWWVDHRVEQDPICLLSSSIPCLSWFRRWTSSRPKANTFVSNGID